jgi:hypothetical protein
VEGAHGLQWSRAGHAAGRLCDLGSADRRLSVLLEGNQPRPGTVGVAARGRRNRGPAWAPASIQFLSTTDRQITTVLVVDKPVFLGLTVSPDGRSLLYTHIDQEGSDLMLRDGFAEH